MNSLVEFWKTCDLHGPRYVHPSDWEALHSEREFQGPIIANHTTFIKSPSFGANDSSFHLSLLPVPYQGNLDEAHIVILLLNPGQGLSDYYTQDHKKHSTLLKRIIRQELDEVPYPFLSLDPEFSWSGGFHWWEKKLRKTAQKIACERKGNYLSALSELSQRMAMVELVPYHSNHFKAHRLLKQMPSVDAAKTFIRETLVPKAEAGQITLIATRQTETFKLPKSKNIIEYRGGLARGAPLGPDTPGGKAILDRILGQ